VYLWVTETNNTGHLLDERCGIRPTDERQQLPSEMELIEISMVRSR
jgi:hypothetical protein